MLPCCSMKGWSSEFLKLEKRWGSAPHGALWRWCVYSRVADMSTCRVSVLVVRSCSGLFLLFLCPNSIFRRSFVRRRVNKIVVHSAVKSEFMYLIPRVSKNNSFVHGLKTFCCCWCLSTHDPTSAAGQCCAGHTQRVHVNHTLVYFSLSCLWHLW